MARVLIVDDSAIMRKNLKAILSKSGYTVVAEATNGEDAYKAYEKHLPDLVTMDVTMPVMDGIQAVKKIIGDFPDAKIVVISAFDQRSMLFQALENGAKQYIIKPITAEKLLQVLSQMLEETGGTEREVVQQESVQAVQEAAPTISDAPAFQSVPNKPDKMEKTPQVAIENQNGTFVIQVPHDLSHAYLDALQTTVQGLLFIKPLALVFRIGELDTNNGQLVARLGELVGTVRQAGGAVEIEAADQTLLHALNNGF